jgi:hypothetical protein
MRLFSNPYTAFLVSIQLLLLARLIWILVDEKRGGGATGSPSVRRRPAREPALTSRGFERAAPARDGSLRSSRTLEVWIDRRSGGAGGRVLAGAYRGRGLETLSRADCLRLNEYCRRADPEAVRLLEAYVKERFLGASNSKPGEPESRRRVRVEGSMTRQHAYEILGVTPAATEREILAAHSALIEGRGSAAEAKLINQAKDTLLQRRG